MLFVSWEGGCIIASWSFLDVSWEGDCCYCFVLKTDGNYKLIVLYIIFYFGKMNCRNILHQQLSTTDFCCSYFCMFFFSLYFSQYPNFFLFSVITSLSWQLLFFFDGSQFAIMNILFPCQQSFPLWFCLPFLLIFVIMWQLSSY